MNPSGLQGLSLVVYLTVGISGYLAFGSSTYESFWAAGLSLVIYLTVGISGYLAFGASAYESLSILLGCRAFL
jgi:amino acid permease